MQSASHGQIPAQQSFGEMSITTLVPVNSQRAWLTALNSFEPFLVSQKATKDAVERIIAEGRSDATLGLVVDKYTPHLV